MKSNLVRAIGLVLALALVPPVVAAQRGGRPPDPVSDPSACEGSGIRCWFGSAAPCWVYCTVGTPVCRGAGCILGFPIPSECYCDQGGIG
jgi:hypothetical protein